MDADLREDRARRNTLAAIFRLPSELMIIVLRILQQTDSLNHISDIFEMPVPSYDGRWTRMMLTCRRMRLIALQEHELWSTIECGYNKQWIEICLERAGDLPLDLRARAHPRYSWRLSMDDYFDLPAKLIDIYTTRARSIHVSLLREQLPETCASALKQSAPYLQVLNIKSTPLHLNQEFLGGYFPSLRELVSDRLCSIDNPPLFTCLRYLRLRIENELSIFGLITLFDRIPAIEILSVTWKSSFNIERSIMHEALRRSPIRLDRLIALQLSGSISPIRAVLHVLPDPSDILDIYVHNGSPWFLSASESHFAVVADRTLTFATGKASDMALVHGTAEINFISHKKRLKFSYLPELRAYNTPSFLYRFPCEFDAPNPILDRVFTLKLHGEPRNYIIGELHVPDAEYMHQIRQVIIERPETENYLRSVEGWIKDYTKTHGKLERFEISGYNRAQEDVVQEVVASLEEANVAEVVEIECR
jgi:hypothetical protein